MKKKMSKILGIVCVASVFAACIITNKDGDPCMWNYILLSIAGITGGASKKMEVAR